MRFYSFFIFLFCTTPIFCQTNGKKDTITLDNENRQQIVILESEITAESEVDSLQKIFANPDLDLNDRANAGRSLAKIYKNTAPAKAISILEQVEVLVGAKRSASDLETYMLKSSAYRIQGNYPKALDEAQKALSLAEQLQNKSGIADAYSSMGQIYERQENFEKALEYHEMSLKLNLSIGKSERIAKSYSNIGNINGQMKRYSAALVSYELSLDYLTKTNDLNGIAMVYGNMGYVYSLQGDSVIAEGGSAEEARLYYLVSINKSKKALEHFIHVGNTNFALNAQNNIALVYNSMNEFEIGSSMCLNVLSESKALGLAPLERDACDCLYKANKGLGNIDQALLYFERFTFLKDSLLNRDEERSMLEKELSYNFEKQAILANELHEQELSTQKRLAQEDAKRRNIIIIAAISGFLILILFFGFLYNRFKLIRKQNTLINQQKEDLQFQKDLVDLKNSEITDSIVYARRFQTAMLPSLQEFNAYLPQSFILFRPKDIVAGDFYWLQQAENELIFGVADCTGHGVPGAMVSLVCSNALNRSVREYGMRRPGDILDKTRAIILDEFAKEGTEVKDGMDIGLVSLNYDSKDSRSNNGKFPIAKLQYSGAHNPLWIIRKDAQEIEEIKANKQPIGHFENQSPFTTHIIDLNKGDSFYLFSDGYIDQFGGEGTKGKKFKAANFKNLLISIQPLTMSDQQQKLNENFDKWKGSLEQLDDVCIIGVRI